MTPWRAVYRLQLTPSFGFAEARALVPYLERLGVSHLYLSPVLEARQGSEHGYDVVDPTRVREELGGEQGLRELASAGLGILLDIVPNHMAVSDENALWADEQERVRVFDIDPKTGWHRRFFTIGELAGVRQDDPEIFELTHRKVLELVADGVVDGLRIDHIDGLARPVEYLHRLRDRGADRVWVEKILELGERLPDWPVEGTTGYEHANDVTALFVDADAGQAFDELYAELTGETRSWEEVAAEAKLEVALTEFLPELEKLSALSGRPLGALAGEAAALPVYRTYEEGDELATRFQQLTSALMAKGIEDTAYYRYQRLLALNEVGGSPGRFGLAVDDFHEGSLDRAQRFPSSLLTTTTHDTKRSGDVRARLAALTWAPDEWRDFLRGVWGKLRDPREEYFLWQTVAGAWPLEPERLEGYMEKALREAGVNTSWVDPNEAHEAEVRSALRSLYDERERFEPFVERVAEQGRRIAVGMTLLKMTVPGLPDIYQGDELEFLALVDPDNRRPVDWEARRRALDDPPPKLQAILAGLQVRDRLGEYEPVDAGAGVCAFRRGEIRVEVGVRPAFTATLYDGEAILMRSE